MATNNNSDLIEIIKQLCEQLEEFQKTKPSFQVFTGFDGFVDKIQKVAAHKNGHGNVFFSSIKEYSEYLKTLSGRSGQVEIITTRTKAGGNAPILSNALATLGVKSYCLGSIGYPNVNPVFNEMNSNVEKIAVSRPGASQALEFEDGKIILSELSMFEEYDWNSIKSKIGLDKLLTKANACTLFALVDWANIPHASTIWQGFLNDVIKSMKKRNLFFLFDLCDPSKKRPSEIDEVLNLISDFSNYGKVTLAVNENEAMKIWLALNGGEQRNHSTKFPSINEIGKFVHHSMNIDTLLIHPIDRTIVFQQKNEEELKGRLVLKPKISTGGGDNLNAGYCLGLLLGLDIRQCMALGMVASGAYVQNGQSATLSDLIGYSKTWREELKQKEIHVFQK